MEQNSFRRQGSLREQTLFWVVFGAVTLLCALPFASRDLAAGHDALFHILRIEGLAAGLRGGAGWPQRIYALLCGGYGYAAGLFYPDLFLLPAALLRCIGLGPELAFKFEVLLCALAAVLTACAAGRAMGNSRSAGLYAMLLYGLCQYHLADLYIRSAVGEAQAMVFAPLVVWGLYDLTEQGGRKPWVLCAGFTGLLLSHTISLALWGLFAVGWVLCRLPRVLHRSVLLRLGGAAAVCLALGAWYWAPLLEQFGADTFRVTTAPLTTLAANAVPAAEFLDLTDFRAPGLTGFAILAAGGVLCLQDRRDPRVRLPAALWAVGAALTFVPLLPSAFWAALDGTFLSAVQFPWRLNGLSQLCLALCCALLLSRRRGRSVRGAAAAAAAVCLAGTALVYTTLPEQVNYPGNYFTGNRGETFYLVGAEWMPEGADWTEFAFEPNAQYTDADGPHTGVYLPDGAFRFDYTGAEKVGVPKLYYKGYTAVDSAGNPVELRKDGAGRVELLCGEQTARGPLTVRYTGTAVQWVSTAFSALTVLALAVFGLVRLLRPAITTAAERKGPSCTNSVQN